MPTLKEVEEQVYQNLGALTAVFMSNPQPGTKQVMPEKDCVAIGEKIMEQVKAYGVSQRKSEIQEADARLRDEFGEDWLEFRDVRLKELGNVS